MSFESQYHATQLRALRKSGGDDEDFIDGIKAELRSRLSSVLLPTCQAIAEFMTSAGHRITPDERLSNLIDLRVGYSTKTPKFGELSLLVFQLTTPVVAVVEDATPGLPPRDIDGHVDVEDVSQVTLAELLNSGTPPREVVNRVERAAETMWLASLQSSWDAFASLLHSMGYNFQRCFFEEESLDMRDSELRVHIGLSAIVSAAVEAEHVRVEGGEEVLTQRPEPQSGALARLQAARTTHSRVRELDLRRAKLGNTDLTGLRADDVDFGEAELSGALLRGAQLVDCRFTQSRLEQVDFGGATLRGCQFDGARAAGARFAGARFEDSFASGIDLTGADLSGAHLSETRFVRAQLRGAKLTGVEGAGVELRGADLSGARLVGAELDDADFRGADLTGADLSGGNFSDADFRGAILDRVRWTDADISSAQFDADASPDASEPSDALPDDASRTVAALIDELEKTLPDAELAQLPVRNLVAALRSVSDGKPPAANDLQALIAVARKALEGQRAGALDPIESLDRLLQVLQAPGDEPPEAWKPWLELVLTALGGKRESED